MALTRLGWYRNVLLFPMGNSNGQANDMVSVYLNYGDQKAVEGWHVCAQFALAISNPNDPTVYIQSRELIRRVQRRRARGADLASCAQRRTIASPTRSRTGDSLGSLSFASSSAFQRVGQNPSSRATRRSSRRSCESSRTPQAFSGTTSTSSS